MPVGKPSRAYHELYCIAAHFAVPETPPSLKAWRDRKCPVACRLAIAAPLVASFLELDMQCSADLKQVYMAEASEVVAHVDILSERT